MADELLLLGAGSSGPGGLQRELVAFWRFEEATSATRLDSSGRGNDLLQSNGVTQETGLLGFGAGFDGVNQKLELASNADVTFGDSDWSIAGWLYIAAAPGGPRRFLQKDSTSVATSRGWSLRLNSARQFLVDLSNDGSTTTSLTDGVNLAATSAWTFWVLSYDSAADLAYLQVGNNAPVSVAFSGGVFNNSAVPVQCSVSPSGGAGLACRLDAVGIWKRLLTAAEISQLYNSGNGLEFPF